MSTMRTYGDYFPSDRKTLLFKYLVVKNILVRRESYDSSCCLCTEYGRERLEFVKSRTIICINEIDTKVVNLDQSANHVDQLHSAKLDTIIDTLIIKSHGFTLGKGIDVF